MKRALKMLAVLGIALVVVAIGGVAAVFITAEEPARPVGFAHFAIVDRQDKPLEIGVWYPTDARPGLRVIGLSAQRLAGDANVAGNGLPLVVMSHGSGGMFSSHSDTALALASAGFVVAAVTHTGDNARDQSYVGTPRWLVDRPRHIRLLIDHMLGRWPAHAQLDPARIGVFGFSAGAFTALVSAGGVPDLARIESYCSRAPEFACTLWKPASSEAAPANVWVHEPRIKASVIAAPGFAFAFEPEGLSEVTSAVQLWSGTEDRNVPTATNAAVVQRLLPQGAEYHIVPGAGHFAFLAPCPTWLLPAVCKDAGGFDRVAFHREFNRAVVAFYQARLAAR